MAREGELKKKPKEAPAAPSLGNFLPVRTEVKTKPVGETEEKKILGNLGYAKRSMGNRIALNDDNRLTEEEIKKLLDFPANFLAKKGEDIPKFDTTSILVTTGPNNGKLINKNGEELSYVFSGNAILYSINDSPRKKIDKNRLEMA